MKGTVFNIFFLSLIENDEGKPQGWRGRCLWMDGYRSPWNMFQENFKAMRLWLHIHKCGPQNVCPDETHSCKPGCWRGRGQNGTFSRSRRSLWKYFLSFIENAVYTSIEPLWKYCLGFIGATLKMLSNLYCGGSSEYIKSRFIIKTNYS